MLRVRISVFSALLAVCSTAAYGQAVVGAKSGIVNYVEGKVFLADAPLELQPAQFPEIKENTVLRTEEGRAEILLTPGVIMRLGENSSFRLVTNRLIDTRIEMLSGSAVVEAADIAKETQVTFVCKDATVTLPKVGIYRFDMEPAPRLKVYKGSAEVQVSGQNVTVGGGKMISLGGALAIAEKFDAETGDSLDRWSRRRGEQVAMASASLANRIRRGFYRDPCASYGGMVIRNLGSWGHNPYYGLITYIPCNGGMMSPYGYRYWTPRDVYRAYYAPRPTYTSPGNGGFSSPPSYSTMGSTSGGYSGTMASGPSVSSSAPAAASTGSSAASSAGTSSVGSGGGGGGGRGR